MNDERLQRWEKIRTTGKKKFLTVFTLAQGLFFAITMLGIKYYRSPEKVDTISIIVLIPFGLMFGFLMSKYFWWVNERKYSQLIKNR